MLKNIVLAILYFYKSSISAVLRVYLGGGCRFKPTCSQFTFDAIKRYGLFEGLKVSIPRFLRCNPFSKDLRARAVFGTKALR